MNRVKKILSIFALILGFLVFLPMPLWCYLLGEYTRVQEYAQMNIYPVEPIASTGTQWLKTTYMVCLPADTQEELKEQIDTYLEENSVIATILKKYEVGKVAKGISLYFIKPSEHWPIGKVARQEEGWDILFYSEEDRLCKITTSGTDPDNWQYEFSPENFEATE